jgi:hypothetical protein
VSSRITHQRSADPATGQINLARWICQKPADHIKLCLRQRIAKPGEAGAEAAEKVGIETLGRQFPPALSEIDGRGGGVPKLADQRSLKLGETGTVKLVDKPGHRGRADPRMVAEFLDPHQPSEGIVRQDHGGNPPLVRGQVLLDRCDPPTHRAGLVRHGPLRIPS